MAPGDWIAWSPTWTAVTVNPAIGNGTNVGAYMMIGKTVHFRFIITMGSTTTYGTGGFRFSLPVAANTSTARGLLFPALAWKSSTAAYYAGIGFMFGTSTQIAAAATTAATNTFWGGSLNTPFGVAYSTGDTISIHGTYDAA